jgi:hypothetical protein
MHLCQIVECRFREILLCSTCLISAYAVLFSWNKFVVQISMQYFSLKTNLSYKSVEDLLNRVFVCTWVKMDLSDC